MTLMRPWIHAALVLLCTLLFELSAAAAAASEYVDVKGSVPQNVSAPLFVSVAYGLIWLVSLGYLALIWRGQRRVEAELQAVRRALIDEERR